MFGDLFLKEFSMMLKSKTYVVICIFMAVFYVTQIYDVSMITEPKVKASEIDKHIEVMKNIFVELSIECHNNIFVTYPLGFSKKVKLENDNRRIVENTIEDLTGLSIVDVYKKVEDFYNSLSVSEDESDGKPIDYTEHIEFTIPDDITYNEFLEKLDHIDKLLGGGSRYSSDSIENMLIEKLTYNEQVEEYENFLKKDKVTRAYARNFCDYMGIILAILPVFLAVNRGLKDKKNKFTDVIYSKKVSSLCVIITRYAGIVILMLIPVFVFGVISTIQTMMIAADVGVLGDVLAYPKYIFGWLLPTILFVSALGLFFTEITSGPIAILVQGIWWYGNVMMGAVKLVGVVGINLVPRFNTVGSYKIYIDVYNQLVINRMVYSIIALVMLLATVVMYEFKRTGRIIAWGNITKSQKQISNMY